MTKTVKVKFLLPSHIVGEATQAKLIGEFNHWNTDEALAFPRREDGNIECVLELQAGQAYQYKYLLNDGRWVTDNAEKAFTEVYGNVVENSVVVVPEPKEKKSVASKSGIEDVVANPTAPVKKSTAKKATVKKEASTPAAKSSAKTAGEKTAKASRKK